MPELAKNAHYRIELCCGDARCWQYLGADSRGQVWWRDAETGREFSESSLMYAWQVAGCDNPSSYAGNTPVDR